MKERSLCACDDNQVPKNLAALTIMRTRHTQDKCTTSFIALPAQARRRLAPRPRARLHRAALLEDKAARSTARSPRRTARPAPLHQRRRSRSFRLPPPPENAAHGRLPSGLATVTIALLLGRTPRHPAAVRRRRRSRRPESRLPTRINKRVDTFVFINYLVNLPFLLKPCPGV